MAGPTYYSTVVVVSTRGERYTFSNAAVALMEPGLFVIADTNKVQLGLFPLGEVESVLYPDGEMKVVSL
jgi:hypothetical protein